MISGGPMFIIATALLTVTVVFLGLIGQTEYAH